MRSYRYQVEHQPSELRGVKTMTHEKIRVVDLFAGCGGLSYGFAKGIGRTKVSHVGAVELDAEAAATYSRNISRNVFVGDIAQWLGSEEMPANGSVDVVLGGPPCQGFSALGKQDVRDHRNDLWDRYVAAVTAMEPAVFILENVPQFLTSEQFALLTQECGGRGRLRDYQIEFAQVLDASLYGAAQRRKRAIVLGRRSDLPPLGVPSPRSASEIVSVRRAFEGLRTSVVDTDLPESEGVVLNDKWIAGPFVGEDIHVTRWRTELSLMRYRAVPAGGNRFDIPDELLAPCWRNHHSGAGDVMGRLHWDRPSVTIRTEFFKPEKGRYLHPSEDRPITHLEAARLQGFPDTFKWFGSKVSIARQIGNAVPIPLGAALGRHVAPALLHRSRRSRAA